MLGHRTHGYRTMSHPHGLWTSDSITLSLMLYETDTKSFAILVSISGMPSALILTVSASKSEKAESFCWTVRGQCRGGKERGCGEG